MLGVFYRQKDSTPPARDESCLRTFIWNVPLGPMREDRYRITRWDAKEIFFESQQSNERKFTDNKSLTISGWLWTDRPDHVRG
jgi:hypothetical protein